MNEADKKYDNHHFLLDKIGSIYYLIKSYEKLFLKSLLAHCDQLFRF